ncbi:restriction endonuclease subunit S [Zhongshania sp.]|jgi:type I restriction enzyme S subunit|uniref:restriction endonuclease subunit S n=1 Tax=Zhongshania sp. TaxID=1971902 RepID=UPI002A83615D|nr:restriction endonuclease subunit S [Zhongshania sp.]
MLNDWANASLGNYVSHQKGFAFKSNDYVATGRPVVRVSNFTDRSIQPNDLKFLPESQAEKHEQFELMHRDVVIATVGSWPKNPASVVGKTIAVPKAFERSLLNQNAVCLRGGVELDQVFLFYLLKTQSFQDYIVSTAQGSANQASITLKSIFNFEFQLPPINEQAAIALILGTLDDKIELNRQMNATLESMAQALFKSWFVDFDPVIDNALAAGNPIPEPLQARAEVRQALGDKRKPLPEAIQQQFPDQFVFTEEMGWVPEGWNPISLTEIVETVSETYPLKAVEQVIFLNTGDIQDGRVLHRQYSKVTGLPGQAKKSIKEGDILYSEIRPENKRFTFVDFDGSDYVVSTKLMVLRCKVGFDPMYAYFLLTTKATIDTLQQLAEFRSGTFPQITYRQLDHIVTVIPSKTEILVFLNQWLSDIQRRKRALISESEYLEKIRETLLPKLLSGEIRIPDAEKLLAEVVK